MAVIGIATKDMTRCIMVHYLVEEFWIDRDLSLMTYINPLIIETCKEINKFSIILHGRPADIRRFSLTPREDNRIIVITNEDGLPLKNCNAIIASEMLADKKYLGLAENVTPIYSKDINSIKWVLPEMKECSILEITLKNNLDKNKYYGLRIGVMLDPPHRISKIRRMSLMSHQYRIHYCTFTEVLANDVAVIKKYLSNDKSQLAEVVFSVSDHTPICHDENTSSLAIYTYKGKLLGIDLDYRIDESEVLNFSKSASNFHPFGEGGLKPPWRCYRMTQRHLQLAGLVRLDNYKKTGRNLNVLRPDWDQNDISYVEIILNKFDRSTGLAYFAIFAAVLSCIYYLLDEMLQIEGTIRSKLILLILSIFLTVGIIWLATLTIFGKEFTD
jgi:hypothetical protein